MRTKRALQDAAEHSRNSTVRSSICAGARSSAQSALARSNTGRVQCAGTLAAASLATGGSAGQGKAWQRLPEGPAGEGGRAYINHELRRLKAQMTVSEEPKSKLIAGSGT